MITGRGILRPWDPIFWRETNYGALNAVTGNTPSGLLPSIGAGAGSQANQVAAGVGESLPAFITSAEANGAGSATVSLTTFTVGDLLIGITCSNQSMVTPTGWSLEATFNLDVDVNVYKRVMQSGDTSALFDMSGANLGTLALVISMRNAANVIEGSAVNNTGGGSISIPSSPGSVGRHLFVVTNGFGGTTDHSNPFTGYPGGYTVLANGSRSGAANRYRIEVGQYNDNSTSGFSIAPPVTSTGFPMDVTL